MLFFSVLPDSTWYESVQGAFFIQAEGRLSMNALVTVLECMRPIDYACACPAADQAAVSRKDA